jgi:hypothetical protein
MQQFDLTCHLVAFQVLLAGGRACVLVVELRVMVAKVLIRRSQTGKAAAQFLHHHRLTWRLTV